MPRQATDMIDSRRTTMRSWSLTRLAFGLRRLFHVVSRDAGPPRSRPGTGGATRRDRVTETKHGRERGQTTRRDPHAVVSRTRARGRCMHRACAVAPAPAIRPESQEWEQDCKSARASKQLSLSGWHHACRHWRRPVAVAALLISYVPGLAVAGVDETCVGNDSNRGVR